MDRWRGGVGGKWGAGTRKTLGTIKFQQQRTDVCRTYIIFLNN